ncbi:MAG: hypothetical protein DRO76_03295 [Candidatus Altiarchaeales archaeon]|nr:MAG: hypothetical protein DRO76_03295 [Candidatus Altiarchaeales archaeon]
MIKRLKVRNFKSLRDFEVDFEKFNVLIGRNNSGKSNIIDCIKFLSNLMDERNLKIAIHRREESYKDIVYGRDYKNNISIEAVVELNGEEFTYRISFSGVNEDIRIEDDEIRIKSDRGEEIIRWEDRKDTYTLTFTRGDTIKEMLYSNVKSLIFSGSYPTLSEDTRKSLYRFSEFMKSVKLYEFYPKEMKEPERRVRKSLQNYIIDENGSNILEVLHTLYLESKQTFDRVSELLQVIEDVEGLKIMPRGGGIYMALKEKRFKEPFPLWNMSDGSLKIIGCITALHTTDFFGPPYGDYKTKIKKPLFCFEEPENYIHSRLLEFLVNLMKDSDAQIILATHSPYFIDRCEPNEIIIVERVNGATEARRIKDTEKLRKVMKKYGVSLGEIYYSDEFEKEREE